jgi:hypothetical protein
MINRYTKGDKNKVLTRIHQVSDVTLYIPTSERCMDYLYDSLMILCYNYVDENNDDSFLRIPYIDFYNVVLFVNKCCKEKDINIEYIFALMSIVRTFENLKYVNIIFKDDNELSISYSRIISMNSDSCIKDIINELTNIYSIDCMEIYLGDMFNQDIVDLINQHFMINGIISNSYLERDFLITFNFEEYISYMDMFINNNIDKLSMYDDDIVDYLRKFPGIIENTSRPNIKLYTNYKDI